MATLSLVSSIVPSTGLVCLGAERSSNWTIVEDGQPITRVRTGASAFSG